ncbi:polyprenyl synthetase family protein [Acidianus sulfidivorans JP7]|uniref:Geranylgeranyl pyrophosphate synthase n=1 Tax=Acidianus sulfidivorans JP7 TaxID=619593 RepID=A0A2U9IM38_9CREN|nr:geranylgeranyl diphosphate synthase [Acidianus sulfidivorans]AWR97108.1 polyprenyl synthetase family protein [Acidianus sulfidivorans JP7]
MELDQYFKEIIENVNIEISNYVKGDIKQLYDASIYLLNAGGKRLRPLFLVATADLFKGDRKRAYKAAAAVEILHNFTLIHDDIMDEDTLRRGIPTVHVKWGIPLAILAGDLLHAKAFQALGDALKGLDNEKIYQGIAEFSKSVIIIAEGQAMDMEFENRDNVTEYEYIDMIKKKTAQLFSCSAYLGGLISNASDYELELLKNFGMNVGISFQIIDDILGLVADEKELGKPVYSDIREGKKTILVIHALENASDNEKRIIMEGLGSKDLDKIKKAGDIIKSLSLDYAYSKAKYYLDAAFDNLNKIHGEEIAGKALNYLVRFTIERRK